MRAARYHGKEDVRIEDIPAVECGKNQIKVRKKSDMSVTRSFAVTIHEPVKKRAPI